MMKQLGSGEPKSTHMNFTLADRSITYPYGVLENVLVKVNDLVFRIDFVILDFPENVETPLNLGRPLLETGKDLIDIELGKLTLRFNKEQVVFNVRKLLKLLKSLKNRISTKEKLKVGNMV